MKTVLKILKWIGFLVLAFLVWLFGWPWVPVLQDNLTAGKYVSYLEQNVQHVDLPADQVGFEFSDDFYAHRLFLFAEVHGYAAPQEFDFALLKHLNAATGVRFYLAELDPAQAIAVNHYLGTGHDGPLRQVLDYWADEKVQWGNRELFAKFEKIRELNATLSVGSRIRFIGVDKIQNSEFAQEFIDADPESGTPFDTTQALNMLLLRAALAREENLGRYDHILSNIELVLDMIPGQEKLYGMWGQFHGMQVPVMGREPLAMRLASDGQLKDDVVTLVSLYSSGSMSMLPSQFLPPPLLGSSDAPYALVPANNDDTYLYYQRGINDLKTTAGESAVSVFNMRGDATPYVNNGRLTKARGFLTSLQSFDVEGSASEASDYIVLFQGSPALTPWKGEAFDVTNPNAE